MVALGPEDALSYTASGASDLKRGFYSLFIYCDVVEPVDVGDIKAPLLRVVNISGRGLNNKSHLSEHPVRTYSEEAVRHD
jgi:hypothetical protein